MWLVVGNASIALSIIAPTAEIHTIRWRWWMKMGLCSWLLNAVNGYTRCGEDHLFYARFVYMRFFISLLQPIPDYMRATERPVTRAHRLQHTFLNFSFHLRHFFLLLHTAFFYFRNFVITFSRKVKKSLQRLLLRLNRMVEKSKFFSHAHRLRMTAPKIAWNNHMLELSSRSAHAANSKIGFGIRRYERRRKYGILWLLCF